VLQILRFAAVLLQLQLQLLVPVALGQMALVVRLEVARLVKDGKPEAVVLLVVPLNPNVWLIPPVILLAP